MMKKRLVSLILTVVVLLSAIPMTASAVTGNTSWAKPGSYTNSAQLISTNHYTVYATQGTPTVDGVKDAAWANAFSFTINDLYNGTTYALSAYSVVSLMWDANNLYILEERPYENDITNKADQNVQGNLEQDGTMYSIMPVNDVDTAAEKYAVASFVYVGVGGGIANGDAAGTVKDSMVFGRKRVMTGTTGTGHTKEQPWYAPADLTSKVVSKAARTAHGYFFETAISWSFLAEKTGCTLAPQANDVLGLLCKCNFLGGSDRNQYNVCGADELYGWQKVQLVETNPTCSYIEPDLSWYNKDATEYTIADAADLMGLMILGSDVPYDSAYLKSIDGNVDGWSRSCVLKGKTIKLTADIDLNPGWKADGTGAKTMGNRWDPIGFFNTTFDGQGHTISGVYCDGFNVRYKEENGFISYAVNSTLKNVSFTNGILTTPNGNQKASIGLIGVVHGNNIAGFSTVIENVYSDMEVSTYTYGDQYYVGGIIGSTYTGANEGTVLIKNVTYAGNRLYSEKQVSGKTYIGTIAGRWNWTGVTTTVIDAVYEGSLEGLPKNAQSSGTDALDTYTTFVQRGTKEDGKFNVRLLGLVTEDELATLAKVGFRVELTVGENAYEAKEFKTGIVYGSVMADGEVCPAADFGPADYSYIYALEILNLPATGTVTLKVTALEENLSGVTSDRVFAHTVTFVDGKKQ